MIFLIIAIILVVMFGPITYRFIQHMKFERIHKNYLKSLERLNREMYELDELIYDIEIQQHPVIIYHNFLQ